MILVLTAMVGAVLAGTGQVAGAAGEPTCSGTGMNQGGFVPSGLVAGGTPVIVAGDLWVLGTDKADRIEVTWTGPGEVTVVASFLEGPVAFTGLVSGPGTGSEGDVMVGGCGGADHVRFSDLPIFGTANPDNKAWGDDGDDHITGGNLEAPSALNLFFGGEGNDHLTGGDVDTNGGNWFDGGDGNDRLTAGDIIGGDFASNRLTAGNGNDVLIAGAVIGGAWARNDLSGGDGNDQLSSGDDTDIPAPPPFPPIPDTPSLLDGGVGGNDRCVGGTFTDLVDCEH